MKITRSLYGDADGTWLFTETPPDVTPPPAIDVKTAGAARELWYLGHPGIVLANICAAVEAMPTAGLRGRTGKIPVQQALGVMLGVSQQNISRYITGGSEPRMSDDQWWLLVRAYYDPGLVAAGVWEVVKTGLTLREIDLEPAETASQPVRTGR